MIIFGFKTKLTILSLKAKTKLTIFGSKTKTISQNPLNSFTRTGYY